MANILVCDDDKEIVDAIEIYLSQDGYHIFRAYDGIQAIEILKKEEIHLLIMDIMMPEMDGMEALRKIRQYGIAVPVLLLTAKGGIADRVSGLNAGADDYLPKPFDMGELTARVKALARRSDSYAPDVISFQNVTLDCNQYALSASQQTIRLNNKEFQMMELFIKHPHYVFSSDHLMERIWGLDSEAGIDVVWTYVGFLRKKLKQIGAEVEIKTIRGAGYCLEEIKC